jgi:superfamily I DNA and RNA helicase
VIDNGTIYLGYPVLATADERVEVDGLLISRDHGLVGFLIADTVPEGDGDWEEAIEEQDRLYAVLESLSDDMNPSDGGVGSRSSCRRRLSSRLRLLPSPAARRASTAI